MNQQGLNHITHTTKLFVCGLAAQLAVIYLLTYM
jgi:hypothetical protein